MLTCLSREFALLRREAAVFCGCGDLGERRGRQRRAGRGNIGPTGGNISVGPFQYRTAGDVGSFLLAHPTDAHSADLWMQRDSGSDARSTVRLNSSTELLGRERVICGGEYIGGEAAFNGSFIGSRCAPIAYPRSGTPRCCWAAAQ